MRRILCFGDSNTYGYDSKGGRYGEGERWPMRLSAALGADFAVVEEGFGGRTCVYDDPIEGGYKSGASYLPPCLMSHNPLDLVILMLGTNDAKRRFGLTPVTIGEGLAQLVRLIRLYGQDAGGQPPAVLIVAPAPVEPSVLNTRMAESFGEHALEVTRGLAAEYARLARLMRCAFFDAAPVAEVSSIDGVHLSRRGHARLAEALAEQVRQILS